MKTLGPIVWDFGALSMQFTVNNQLFTLKGMQSGIVKFASKRQMAKFPVTKETSTLLLFEESYLHLMSVNSTVNNDEIATVQLQDLL